MPFPEFVQPIINLYSSYLSRAILIIIYNLLVNLHFFPFLFVFFYEINISRLFQHFLLNFDQIYVGIFIVFFILLI